MGTLAHPERTVTFLGRFLDDGSVTVEVPVEERPDVVVLVGDEAVHGHHCMHHHGRHTGIDLQRDPNSSQRRLAQALVSAYAEVAARIRHALWPAAVVAEHVGSTSVPGLAAKPVLDVLLLVPDPSDE